MHLTSSRPAGLSRAAGALIACTTLVALGSTAGRARASPGRPLPAAFIAMPDGAPEAVLWDGAHHRLYVIDNTGNRIWRWTDAGGLVAWATLPLPAGATSLSPRVTLGQAALLADGTLVVARFGEPGGGASGIAWVRPDGTAGLVPNLDPGVLRLGVAVAPDGTIYGSTFKSKEGVGLVGTITRVSLGSGETLVADGFGKLVGLVVAGERLYVSDQSNGKILDAPLGALPPHAGDWHVLATLVKPDQICAGPAGGLFSGQFEAGTGSSASMAIRWITGAGAVTPFRQDPDVSRPSGLAYDPRRRRLFAADSGNLAHVGVHVFPVP